MSAEHDREMPPQCEVCHHPMDWHVAENESCKASTCACGKQVPFYSDEMPVVADYGLGTYKGEPLVLVPRSMQRYYHRHDHGGRFSGTLFTESFMRDGWHLRPCRTCFGGKS